MVKGIILGGFAINLALLLAGCSGTEDNQAPERINELTTQISVFDTLTVEYDEGIQKIKLEQIESNLPVKFIMDGSKRIKFFGNDFYRGLDEPSKAPVFSYFKPNTTYRIVLKDIEDQNGNSTNDTLIFDTDPILDSEGNDAIQQADTLGITNSFFDGSDFSDGIKLSGILEDGLISSDDIRDIYAIQLKKNSNVTISINDFNKPISIQFKGPLKAGTTIDNSTIPFFPANGDQPGNIDYIESSEESDSLTLTSYIDLNRHGIGLGDDDSISSALWYWIEIAYIDPPKPNIIAPTNYRVEIKIN